MGGHSRSSLERPAIPPVVGPVCASTGASLDGRAGVARLVCIATRTRSRGRGIGDGGVSERLARTTFGRFAAHDGRAARTGFLRGSGGQHGHRRWSADRGECRPGRIGSVTHRSSRARGGDHRSRCSWRDDVRRRTFPWDRRGTGTPAGHLVVSPVGRNAAAGGRDPVVQSALEAVTRAARNRSVLMHGAIDSSIAQVFAVVTRVRNRWRWTRVVRGAAIALAGAGMTIIASALILEATNYRPGVVIGARIVIVLVTVVLGGWFVIRPMLPRPRDEQVALYVEEHEPTLEGSLVSAVEVSRPGEQRLASSAISERVRGMAIERSRAVGNGSRVDARGTRLAFAALGGATAALLMVITFGPASLRYGMASLLNPWQSAETVNPFRLDVLPGDATVARGATVLISAVPVGFQPGSAELWARTSDTAQWRRIPMTSDTTAQFSARLLDVSAATEYLVETNGLRSRTFKLSVADLPYTRQIDLEYRYPAYTGMPVQRVDSAGDIAAVAGTLVRVRVHSTVPTKGGRLVVENVDTLSLTPAADGTLSATLRVKTPGFYRIELEGARGDLLTASLNYAIDVLPDRPPSVRLAKPARDTKVLAVDEVYTEASAQDDYGVAKLDLVYSVNGGQEKTAPLHQGARAIRETSAGHTFMLEEYQLEPGDVVSYYARATDNNASGAQTATSDIYFMQVRPYSQEYRQEQGGGGGGGGGGGDSPGQFSQRQREIIAATFNALRDSATATSKTLQEDMATLRLAQQRLREEVEQLTARLIKRGIAGGDSNFAKIAQILPQATAAMDTVERTLAESHLRGALQPEQRALQQLQRAEAVFREVRVAMGQQGGGGGGGGGQQQAEDLADLFELQQERMRNQYETLNRGQDEQEQQANQEVDATAERLRQLAARIQQENERARRKADSLGSQMGASGASGGESQRQLAREMEEQARQLERLARERESQELADAARRLNESADGMRRAAANSGQRSAQQAESALDRLRDARRLLDQEQDNRVRRGVEDAARAARRLAQEQERIANDVSRQDAASGAERDQLQQSIEQRKDALADSARALGSRLDRMSLDAQREQPAVARQIKEAVDTLRARRVEDHIRASQQELGRAPQEYQNLRERLITSGIGQFNREMDEALRTAQSAQDANGERRNADAMDRARELVRGMESIDERLRQGQEGGRQQQGAREGQQGQRGEQGQAQGEGQRGQGQAQGEGQRGQQGQGQGQQAPGGGREGQQGGGGQPGSGETRGGGGGGNAGQTGGEGGPPMGAEFRGQLSREMRERLNDARALRRELSQRGDVDLDQLDSAIRQMEGIARGIRAGVDPRSERDLRNQVIDGLRNFEFQLGRAFGEAGGERVLVDRAGEVPPEYRKYVEEYYRALGRAKPR